MERRTAYGILKLRETWEVREATCKTMQANRGTETKPEIDLRRALWAAGMRGYRKNVRRLSGKPDIVFGPAKLAIFVHGCYWHSCPTCTRNRTPKTNPAYWQAKFAGNRDRDARNQAELEAIGWRVVVIWQCELKPKTLPSAVARIANLLGRDAGSIDQAA